MLLIQNVKTWEAEASPICLSYPINRLLKFQLPRPPHSGFRAFQSLRLPHFFTHPLDGSIAISQENLAEADLGNMVLGTSNYPKDPRIVPYPLATLKFSHALMSWTCGDFF